MKKTIVAVVLSLASVLAAGGCKKHEIPQKLQGRFEVPRFMLGNESVVVSAKAFDVPDCKVNCGVEHLPLTDISCEPLVNPTKCTYKSEHCTGSIELERDGNVSIKADVVPGATGDALGTRNMTCATVSGNDLKRL